MSFGSRLQRFRQSRNLTQEDVSKRLQISKSAVSMYERDQREPSFELVQKIAYLFDVSVSDLLEERDVSNVISLFEQRMIKEGKMFPYTADAPTVGKAHAGEPAEMLHYDVDTHPLPPTIQPSANRNWIEVEGDCMDGGHDPIRPGYLVLVDREMQFSFGDVVVVIFKDEYQSMLRMVRKLSNGTILLVAANTQYEPIILDGREDIEIYGVVIDVSQNWQGRKKRIKEDE